jgi:putative toxin-antitoxin system antitoxin component (TIGR02293 family)
MNRPARVAPVPAPSAPVAPDPDLARTLDLLGGSKVIRTPVRTPLEAHDLLAHGLPAASLFHLGERIGLGAAELVEALGMSLRTLQRRRDDQDRSLSPEQSGRAWTLAEILGRATDVFGSREEALDWLRRPALALDDRRPVDLLRTPAGAEAVSDHLTRLEYGVYT